MGDSEFSLIDEIVQQLGEQSQGRWVRLGPGDDACVVNTQPDTEWVGSIDTLLADVHFPAGAPAHLIGYRALMVGLSDIAAMAATPRYVLVALTLPDNNLQWVRDLARGMAEAAAASDVYLCGGNLSRGPLSISVSVHGDCPRGSAITRAQARPGDTVYVSGELGGAAACVRQADFTVAAQLSVAQQKYYLPRARFDMAEILRGQASAAIDISDGLVADLAHLSKASGVAVRLQSERIPVCEGATLDDALFGGDDYELLYTSAQVPDLTGSIAIGRVVDGDELFLDGVVLAPRGYDHFIR